MPDDTPPTVEQACADCAEMLRKDDILGAASAAAYVAEKLLGERVVNEWAPKDAQGWARLYFKSHGCTACDKVFIAVGADGTSVGVKPRGNADESTAKGQAVKSHHVRQVHSIVIAALAGNAETARGAAQAMHAADWGDARTDEVAHAQANGRNPFTGGR